jgi:hypothetical protein
MLSGSITAFAHGQIIADPGNGQVTAGSFVNEHSSNYYSGECRTLMFMCVRTNLIGAALVSMHNPALSANGKSVADILVYDETGQPCVAMCLAQAKVIGIAVQPPNVYTRCTGAPVAI